MFIEHEPPKRHPSSVRSGMSVVQCVARTVCSVFIAMPLLTELVSSEVGFSYKHGAPNGAVLQASTPFHRKQRGTLTLPLAGGGGGVGSIPRPRSHCDWGQSPITGLRPGSTPGRYGAQSHLPAQERLESPRARDQRHSPPQAAALRPAPNLRTAS